MIYEHYFIASITIPDFKTTLQRLNDCSKAYGKAFI